MELVIVIDREVTPILSKAVVILKRMGLNSWKAFLKLHEEGGAGDAGNTKLRLRCGEVVNLRSKAGRRGGIVPELAHPPVLGHHTALLSISLTLLSSLL
jgi:hypothetical protein